MPRSFDIRVLRTFLAVIDYGGFTRAGEKVHLSQSAVSNQIKRLEAQLGFQLVDRSGQTEMLTEEGRILQSYAKKIVGANDEAFRSFSPRAVAGVVRLGVVEEFADDRLVALLAEFGRKFPKVKVDFTVDLTRNLLGQLQMDELDVAVFWRNADSDAEGVTLARERLVWAAHRDFVWREDESVRLILSPAPCIHRLLILDALERAQRTWRIVCHAPTLTSVRLAVLAGLGIAALDERSVLPTMRVLDVEDGLPLLPSTDLVLRSRPDLSAAATALLELVQDRS